MKTDADEMGFDVTASASGTESRSLPDADDQTLADKKPVLRYKERDIHVQNVRLDNDRMLVGQVSEISNVCSVQYEGLKLGQTISFRYQHIQHFA